MGDKLPNYRLEIRRLQVEIDQAKLNKSKNELGVLTMQDEIEKLGRNIEALDTAIEQLESKLATLKEHGDK